MTPELAEATGYDEATVVARAAPRGARPRFANSGLRNTSVRLPACAAGAPSPPRPESRHSQHIQPRINHATYSDSVLGYNRYLHSPESGRLGLRSRLSARGITGSKLEPGSTKSTCGPRPRCLLQRRARRGETLLHCRSLVGGNGEVERMVLAPSLAHIPLPSRSADRLYGRDREAEGLGHLAAPRRVRGQRASPRAFSQGRGGRTRTGRAALRGWCRPGRPSGRARS